MVMFGLVLCCCYCSVIEQRWFCAGVYANELELFRKKFG